VDQVIEYLFSKCEFNPQVLPKKKKKGRNVKKIKVQKIEDLQIFEGTIILIQSNE
jgi:hypothetical protein